MKNLKISALGISLLVGFLQINAQEPNSKNSTDKNAKQEKTLTTDTTDPVCGMKVKKGTTLVSVHKDKEYGFCSKMCKQQFDKHPKKYVK